MRTKLPGSIEREVQTTRAEFEAIRQLAGEAADALAAGHVIHVSGTRETDLRELVRYCTAQIERIDQGLAPLGAMAYLEAIMRVMRPHAH
jgi:hypothetical protein